MKIHLELLVLAVLAGSLTNQVLLQFNTPVLVSIVSSLMVFGVGLFLLEKRFGHNLDGFYQLFSRIPLAWVLTLCTGVYSYSFAVILQLPIWAIILVVGTAASTCWYWTQKKFG
jgi:hypothetical protein